MEVTVAPLRGRADLARFVELPFAIFADDPVWVPPLRLERRRHLSPRHNPYFQHAEAGLFLAWRGGRPVGRISAQLDRLALHRDPDAPGHFGFLDAIDDGAVFAALLGAAEEWVRARQVQRITGPFSFSINDEAGLLVDGFDAPPVFLMGHARRWYGPRLVELGYAKAMDLIAYHVDLRRNALPASARRVADRLELDPRVRIRSLDRSDYAAEVRRMIDLFNDAWSANWGFVPFTEAEMARLAADLKHLVRDDYVCLVETGGEPAAFGIILPNLNEAIADLGGRLFPTGWAKLLYRLKAERIRSARLPLMGVRRRHHGSPLGAAMAFAVIARLHAAACRHGMVHGEVSWVLETNTRMRRIIEASGAIPYKAYRVFEKRL